MGRRVPRNSNYKSLNFLMRHIRDSSGIRISGGAHKRALAQMGYFHGYKGYRYSRPLLSAAPWRRIACVLDPRHGQDCGERTG